MNITELIAMIDPTIYENLKRAVELGKWDTGTPLSKEQTLLCMQAIIAYDIKHKPEQERVGYVSTPQGAYGTLSPVESSINSSQIRPVKLLDK